MVLAVIGVDLWWSGTPTSFEFWWIPLMVLNGAVLLAILWPLIRGR